MHNATGHYNENDFIQHKLLFGDLGDRRGQIKSVSVHLYPDTKCTKMRYVRISHLLVAVKMVRCSKECRGNTFQQSAKLLLQQIHKCNLADLLVF